MLRTVRNQSTVAALVVLTLTAFLSFYAEAAAHTCYSVTEQCAKGTWTTKADLPLMQSLAAVAEVNGKLYVVGGYDASSAVSTLQIYDPVTDRWTTGAPIPMARYAAAAAGINGKLYVAGGCTMGGNNICSSTTVGRATTLDIYDPGTNTWATGAPLPTPRGWLAAAAINGKLYVVGGWKEGMIGADAFSILEVYDPATDSWTTGAPMPTPRFDLAAGVIDGKLYAVGGFYCPNGYCPITGGRQTALEVYDPATDTWTLKAPMSVPRNRLAAGVVDGKLYAIGGYTGSSTTVVEGYDPATDSWTTDAAMPTSRAELGAAAIDGKLYAVGGYVNTSSENHFSQKLEAFTPGKDTTPPQIYAADVSTAATSSAGAVVNYSVSVTDDCDPNPMVTVSQLSGISFPIGTTTVMVTARDTSGNTTMGNFNVNVIDYPPDLSLPDTIFTDATTASGAVVNYIASAHDTVDGDRPVTCSPSSGGIFAVGETVVNCSSTDAAGHTNTGSFDVFVLGLNQEATTPGYDVPVTSTDSGLSLTFAYVDQPGVTTIAPIDAGTIGTTPAGFAVSGVAYEISTTSPGATDNGVQLAFVVPNSANMSRTDFESLRVLHNNNGMLEDITSGYDYDNRIVYAYTYSFSPFYLVRTVTTNIEMLFDRSTAYKAGSTIPVKIRVRDVTTNTNLSSSSLTVTARSVKRLGNSTASTANDSGAANPDSNFRYLGEKDGGSYIFNLSTKRLVPGTYVLSFYVGSDRSFFYTVKFEVK
jgi:N-acetylneuraminic acid mutarotase